jgi:flagellar biogenesis protein FliO
VHLLISILNGMLSGIRTIGRSRRQRSMRLCETLPLGDRRYLALVEVDGHRFLVGAAGNSLSLLARLSLPPEAPEVLSNGESDLRLDAEEYKTWR